MSNAPLNERFQLEIDLLRMERQRTENEAALRQAKFDLREANAAQVEYGGSFRALRDRFTGRREETETALRHAIQQAETNLASAQREKESLDARLAEVNEQLSRLPAWESLNDGSTQWHRLEARYCAEWLIPQLEIHHELLLERRAQFNGTNAGQIKTRQDLADIYSAPEAAGEACKPYLLRLKSALNSLEIPFELHRCFEDPTAFLSSATQFTRMDRINTAIAQVESLQNLLPNLQKQLEG